MTILFECYTKLCVWPSVSFHGRKSIKVSTKLVAISNSASPILAMSFPTQKVQSQLKLELKINYSNAVVSSGWNGYVNVRRCSTNVNTSHRIFSTDRYQGVD